MGATTSIPATTSVPSPPPSVPFYSSWTWGGGISTLGAFLSIVIFTLSFVLQSTDSSTKTGLRAAGIAGILIFGLVSFFMSSLGANTISYFKTSTGLGGNSAAALLVIVVSIIAFALVFIPSYSGATTISDPYLGALVGVIVGAVALGFIGILARYSERAKPAEVITHITLILYHFLPYALFLFGPLVDIITQKLQFTPASIVGFSSIFINWIVSIFFNKGVTPIVENYACEIPGLAAFTSNLVPQPMMSTLSAVAYIAAYVSKVKLSGGFISPTMTFAANTNAIWPIWTFYGALYGLHAAVLNAQKCLTPGKAIAGLLAPAMYGGLVGLIASEVLEPKASASATGSPPILGSTTPTVGTCAAGSSDGEFICESFENGKLKTKVMTE
jgi:hypothetical protein